VQYHIRRGQIARDAETWAHRVPIYEQLIMVQRRPDACRQSPSRNQILDESRLLQVPPIAGETEAGRRARPKLCRIRNHVGKALVYGGEVCFNAGFPFVSPVMRETLPLKYFLAEAAI